jgi:hypothetical protein
MSKKKLPWTEEPWEITAGILVMTYFLYFCAYAIGWVPLQVVVLALYWINKGFDLYNVTQSNELTRAEKWQQVAQMAALALALISPLIPLLWITGF